MKTNNRIAVVGSGISGLAAAWLLSERYKVTLFEATPRLGGHTHTVDVTLDGHTHPVDTGFLVFNNKTYPNLTALFAHLEVESVESEMSFAVSLDSPKLEWAGASLSTVFGQTSNLIKPKFWRMLADVLRFNRESVTWLLHQEDSRISLRSYLERGRYSDSFVNWYLLPMAAAIWSCPPGQMLDYPLATFVRFCRNHGLLQITNRPVWRTVKGGARTYVDKLAAGINDIRLSTPVHRVFRTNDGVLVGTEHGAEAFDQVVMACHSDQALNILGSAANSEERQTLPAIAYQNNHAVLHTDESFLPRNRKLWSAWNYRSGSDDAIHKPVSVSYLISRLQPLPFKQPVVVTLNPHKTPDPAKTIASFNYAHPVFDGPAIAAQSKMEKVSGKDRIWYCGAWNGYGFHEDGLNSALRVANSLGCRAPWQETNAQKDAA